MTDMVNDEALAGSQQAAMPAQMPKERVFTQAEVNELVGKTRHEGYERGIRESQSGQKPQQFDEATLGRIVEEKMQAQVRSAIAQQVVSDFVGKMEAGKGKYEDFEQKVSGLDLKTIPQIVQLANGTDNTADVVYDLANNPYKVATLLTLAEKSPHLAQAEIARLSNSIKSNQKAVEAAQPKEPLSQIKPSATTGDGSAMSIASLRRAPWMKA